MNSHKGYKSNSDSRSIKYLFQAQKRLVPQIILQIVLIASTAAASYLFLTYLVTDVFAVENTYLSAMYEILGTLGLMIIVLVSINTRIYRKRLSEINILSGAIQRVAKGDFIYRIPINPREPMAGVYENFNYMIGELASVQILRQDFINNYSHEFKTPIASIEGFAELLLKKDLPPEAQREYLEIIRDESARLTTLAQNTIMLSKLDTQQTIINIEEYNLGEQLKQCAIICSPSWLGKKQILDVDAVTDVSYIGDREMMQHLWLNLLNNAIKYTPEEGTITIRLSETEKEITAEIIDTGDGMDEATMKYLFVPYYQGDSSRSAQGLGLGLSIAGRIAELCGGRIEVSSKIDLGSTFKVILPHKSEAPDIDEPGFVSSLYISAMGVLRHLRDFLPK